MFENKIWEKEKGNRKQIERIRTWKIPPIEKLKQTIKKKKKI